MLKGSDNNATERKRLVSSTQSTKHVLKDNISNIKFSALKDAI